MAAILTAQVLQMLFNVKELRKQSDFLFSDRLQNYHDRGKDLIMTQQFLTGQEDVLLRPSDISML